MANSLFTTNVGFQLENDQTGASTLQIFAVAGIPGDAGLSVTDLALSNNAVIGSIATDSLTGLTYRKTTAGTGTATWVKVADITDAAASISWREPVLVKDDTTYANLAAAETAVNTGTIDGVTVVTGSRILFTGITGANKNVRIVTGTVGAGATLVEDSNTLTNNDTLRVDSGTSASKQFSYNSTTNLWVDSTPAAAPGTPVTVTANGVTTQTAVDSVLVDTVKMVNWQVHVQQGNKVITYQVDATHDGTTAADATEAEKDKYSRLRMNGHIAGFKLDVDVNGTGVAQVMRLLIEATAAVNVTAVRTQVI